MIVRKLNLASLKHKIDSHNERVYFIFINLILWYNVWCKYNQ
jgi:hypothetical protein